MEVVKIIKVQVVWSLKYKYLTELKSGVNSVYRSPKQPPPNLPLKKGRNLLSQLSKLSRKSYRILQKIFILQIRNPQV